MTTFARTSLDLVFSANVTVPTAGSCGSKITQEISKTVLRLNDTGSQKTFLFHDLNTLASEYGLLDSSQFLVNLAKKFLLSLPSDIKMPDLDIDNDGDISFEWFGTNKKIMSLSLSKNGAIHYSARISDIKRRSGKDYFDEAIPSEIIKLIHEVTE